MLTTCRWGKAPEGEASVVHEIPLDKVTSWLKAQERKGKIVDLRVYAGLYLLKLSGNSLMA